MNELKGKKVLQMGLGILGGGVATAKWLVEQGAILTVTDLKDEKFLGSSLEKLNGLDIKYVLAGHAESDFLDNDIIVINPDVPAGNKFVEVARKAGKQIENELTLFFRYAKYKTVIGITGTRGKTTTTNWTGFILQQAGIETRILGNDPEKAFLSEINSCTPETVVVMEVPSYQLEIFGQSGLAPHIAIITNLYRDHINRHKSMEEYAGVKANIFAGQGPDDFLILNKNNEWTQFFLDQKPKAKVLFFGEEEKKPEFVEQWGEHNSTNLEAAILAARTVGVPREEIEKSIATLPQIKFRQEKVYDQGGLQIYNDTAATSPDGAIAAMQRFPGAVFISGGTDRELDYTSWAEAVRKYLKPENLILLSGSATEKMKKELGWAAFNESDTLGECLDKAVSLGVSKIVFSPGAKSFEKFKNEFDRGGKFNDLVRNLTK